MLLPLANLNLSPVLGDATGKLSEVSRQTIEQDRLRMDHGTALDDEALLNECKQAGWSSDTYLFPFDPIIGVNMEEALDLREVEKAAL